MTGTIYYQRGFFCSNFGGAFIRPGAARRRSRPPKRTVRYLAGRCARTLMPNAISRTPNTMA
jgi:hypothetical protein